jgi:hypothetical protein
MKPSRPNFKRNSFDYYIYFSDRYLTEEEIKSKKTKKNGFYLVLTKKRATFLLPFYEKEVKILSESPYGKKILDIIKSHNNLVNYYSKPLVLCLVQMISTISLLIISNIL